MTGLFYCAPEQLYHTASQHLSRHPVTAIILKNMIKHIPIFSKYLKKCNTQERYLDFMYRPLITCLSSGTIFLENNSGSTVNFTVYFQGNYEIFKYINCNAQYGKIKHMTRILILLLKTEKQRGYK